MIGKCPICDMNREDIENNKYFPFCSGRCKLIDLGEWLFERRSIEIEPEKWSEEDV